MQAEEARNLHKEAKAQRIIASESIAYQEVIMQKIEWKKVGRYLRVTSVWFLLMAVTAAGFALWQRYPNGRAASQPIQYAVVFGIMALLLFFARKYADGKAKNAENAKGG